MAYPPPPPPRRKSRITGIIVYGALIVVVGMVLMIGLTILGAVFAQFNKLNFPTSPQNWAGLYNTVKTTMANVFPLVATLVIIASIGVLVLAIFKLTQPGSEY